MGMRGWLEEAIKIARLPPPPRYPRDLEREVKFMASVTLIPIFELSADKVRDYLEERNFKQKVAKENRELYGCLVSQAGRAFLFVDEKDPEDERRFTVGHELSHFVLDHLVPRYKAIRALGEGIRPVLDGRRRPTPREQLNSALQLVLLGVQVSLMARGAKGAKGARCSRNVQESEQRADELALELLAPEAEAIPVLKAARDRTAGAKALAQRFGLPAEQAEAYADRLLRQLQPRTSSLMRLFGVE